MKFFTLPLLDLIEHLSLRDILSLSLINRFYRIQILNRSVWDKLLLLHFKKNMKTNDHRSEYIEYYKLSKIKNYKIQNMLDILPDVPDHIWVTVCSGISYPAIWNTLRSEFNNTFKNHQFRVDTDLNLLFSYDIIVTFDNGTNGNCLLTIKDTIENRKLVNFEK